MIARAFLLFAIVMFSATRPLTAGAGSTNELKAVAESLQPILQKLNPGAKVEYSEGAQTLTITYLPQTFKVHSRSMNGEIALKAHDEIGPSYKGFVLMVSLQPKGLVNQAVTPQTMRYPYWATDMDVTPFGKTGKQLYWGLSYGSRTDYKLLYDIRFKLKSLSK